MRAASVAIDRARTTTAFWARTAAILFSFLALGLPLDSLLSFAVFAVLLLVAATGLVTRDRGRWAIALLTVVSVHAILWALPRPEIEEGSNMLAVWEADDPLSEVLPPSVYRPMIDDLHDVYADLLSCDKSNMHCRHARAEITAPYAPSVRSLWRPTELSGIVDGIDFSSVMDLRPSFMRDTRFNWARSNPYIKRERPPYFVHYRIPSSLAGAELCWRGKVFWLETGVVEQVAGTEWTCRTVPSKTDSGAPALEVFAYDTGQGMPLAMRLDPGASWTALASVRLWLPVVSAVAVAWLLVAPVLRRLVPVLFVAAGAIVVTASLELDILTGQVIQRGGRDGLFHEGVGHKILWLR